MRGASLAAASLVAFAAVLAAQSPSEPIYPNPIDVNPPHISTDASVKYDYDIAYVRTPRRGDKEGSNWAEIAHPGQMDARGDLMLLHPDGSEERLVEGGPDGSVADPAVSFDGQWIYYAHLRGLGEGSAGRGPTQKRADIFKIHVKSRQIVRLTQQTFTPNTGVGSLDYEYGVFNLGPFPIPDNRLVFVSNRNAFKSPKHEWPALQLFVMDDDGRNVELIGQLNVGMALHPICLVDGRILFSSLESQGLRAGIHWGLWSIHPDGTNWGPVLSALVPGEGAPNAVHFQTQLSDGHIVAEEYYNQNNSGFGAYLKIPIVPPERYPQFGPAWTGDPRNTALRFGRFFNAKGIYERRPFSPVGIESFTPFSNNGEGPSGPAVLGKADSLAVGKVTHPSGAPDNHLLTVWSPGPVNHQYQLFPMPDGGIYLIKSGKAIDEPGQMRLIRNDPKFNEQWPRAVVPYRRIYGVDQPSRLAPLANDGRLSPELPEGTPYALVGTASLYKRESYPGGRVPDGTVTATFPGGHDGNGYQGLDPFNTAENGASLNWVNQGADAGRYSNDDIHAVRILAMEPTSERGRSTGPQFFSHANEQLRILGEIPVRKFTGDRQPTDPDGNPDTSFLAKIPADTVFTFQTLDRNGMVLNMAQTWHQLRPGEVRTNCGGCHAHSQKPTEFSKTAAARKDYTIFDLTKQTPLLTSHPLDTSGRRWDSDGTTGLRYEPTIKNVEYFRDVKPILDRSCTACHSKRISEPAGNLVLDDYDPIHVDNLGDVPGTYYRLALDSGARFGYKPVIGAWRQTNASRYIRKFQSRRSLMIWKIFGHRTDGWSNDDFPTERVPGDPRTLELKGMPVADTPQNRNRADLDFRGSVMPPAAAIAGTYVGQDGRPVKVAPLTDEDRLTIVRWIDLGCPIDLDGNATATRGKGWMFDEARPTVTLTSPRHGTNPPLSRVLVGMVDYYTGLDMRSFQVTTSFPVDGARAGQNLASQFRQVSDGVWELKLATPIQQLASGSISVSIMDRQGNVTRIERQFSVSAATAMQKH